MSMILNNIIEYIEDRFPLKTSENWDNTGIQILDGNSNVVKILITLDITDKSVDYAIENEINLIVSHHPFLFLPVENIDLTTYKGNLIKKTILNNINCYSMHTNYDISQNGMYEAVKELFSLNNCELLRLNDMEPQLGYGIVGELNQIYNIDSFLDLINNILEPDYKIAYNIENLNEIKKVAFCGGSGAEFIVDASKKQVDIYITGDIKHHDAQLAYETGVPLLDVSHYGLEKIFINHVEKLLKNKFTDLELFKYEANDFRGIITK